MVPTLRWLLAALCVVSLLQPRPPAQGAQTPRRPNILFAMADDWGWPHAGALGDRVVATATFDRLAREGVLFDHAWVSSPSCTPSRNAVLTGQQFWRLGEGANLHSTLDVAHPNFMSLLRLAGYEIGHWRKAWGPGDAGAGGYEGHPCGPGGTFERFLAGRDPQKPFCFWFGTSDPHRGYEEGSGHASGIDLSAIELPACWPDRAEVRSDVADYYHEVARWDRDVGTALELLERDGLLDDTIVVVTGDHGMPFPRGKGNLYDLGARVPLVVRWARIDRPGRTESAFVSLTDLAPTFLEAAGVPVPDAMTGRSLLPLLVAMEACPPAERDGVVFGRERHTPAQAMPSLAGYPSRAIRTADWLLILNLEPERWPAGVPEGATHPAGRLTDCDDGPTKRLLMAGRDDPELLHFHRLCFGRRPAVELYDCGADPWQVHDLAADPAHAATVASLRERLVAHLAATGDPRFTDAPVRFDDHPYRAKYLERHLAQHRERARAQPRADRLRVYVLAGQSNMQGHARVETFGYLADDPATAPLLAKMQQPDGTPRVIDGVWISYLTQGKDGDEAVTGRLTAGFGARRDPARSDGKIGPELAFGIRVAEAGGGPVLLIKTAWGGKSLHTDFRPPSAGPSVHSAAQLAQLEQRGADVEAAKAARTAATGRYYRAMIEHVRRVLADPAAVCPDYDPSAGYELCGFVWFQGWNDMVDRGEYPERDRPGGYDAYTECLAHLIRDVRRDLETPGLPFVIGVMGVGGPIEGEPEGVRRVHANFRAAMARPAAMHGFRGSVVAVETAPFWPMELQAIADRRAEVDGFARRLRRDNEEAPEGERLTKARLDARIEQFRRETLTDEQEATWRRGASNAAYHYFGCARTMAGIGAAFADAVLRLEPR